MQPRVTNTENKKVSIASFPTSGVVNKGPPMACHPSVSSSPPLVLSFFPHFLYAFSSSPLTALCSLLLSHNYHPSSSLFLPTYVFPYLLRIIKDRKLAKKRRQERKWGLHEIYEKSIKGIRSDCFFVLSCPHILSYERGQKHPKKCFKRGHGPFDCPCKHPESISAYYVPLLVLHPLLSRSRSHIHILSLSSCASRTHFFFISVSLSWPKCHAITPLLTVDTSLLFLHITHSPLTS